MGSGETGDPSRSESPSLLPFSRCCWSAMARSDWGEKLGREQNMIVSKQDIVTEDIIPNNLYIYL